MKKKSKRADFRMDSHHEENTLLLYLQEINRIPLLSKDEETEMAKLAAQGDKAARERLVTSNLRFVIMIAKKYQNKGLPLQDLISEGNIGLLNAVNHFDVEKGYRFITYAVWWIRQSIIKAIHEKGRMIRLPTNKTKELTNIEKARQVIQNEPNWNHETEIRETALFLDMSPEKAEKLMQIHQEVLSLEDPISKHGQSFTIKDFIEDEYHNSPVEHTTNKVLKDKLETVLNGLEKRSAEVLRSRFGLGDTGSLTLKEVGERYNLSRERVRQIEKRALTQLQRASCHHNLDSYIA